MMCKSHRNVVAVSVLVIFPLGVLNWSVNAAEAYRKLSDSEIKAKLAGMEMSDPHFSEQYMRDGTVRTVTMGRRIVGKWHVKGDQLCIEAPKPEDSRCKEVWRSGDKYQLRVEGDPVPYDVILQKQQQRGW